MVRRRRNLGGARSVRRPLLPEAAEGGRWVHAPRLHRAGAGREPREVRAAPPARGAASVSRLDAPAGFDATAQKMIYPFSFALSHSQGHRQLTFSPVFPQVPDPSEWVKLMLPPPTKWCW